MTTNRDFDRLARAWLDLMPDEAPDRLIANVRLAVDVTPQQRAWRRLAFRRPFQVNRLTLISAVAALVSLALVGGMVGVRLLTMTVAPTPAPQASSLQGRWVTAELLPELLGGPSGLTRFTFEIPSDGGIASVRNNPNETVPAAFESIFHGEGNVFTLETVRTVAADRTHFWIDTNSPGQRGCLKGDVGRYAFDLSPDGLELRVTLIADGCPARGGFMPRAWVRQVSGVAPGKGVLQLNEELVSLALVPGAYQVQGGFDRIFVTPTGDTGGEGRFFVLTAPLDFAGSGCGEAPVAGAAIEPSVAGVRAFLARHPELAIIEAPAEAAVAGVRAVHVDIESARGCDSVVAAMAIGPDDAELVHAGEHADLSFLARGGRVLVVGYVGSQSARDEWQAALLSSMRFFTATGN